MVAFPTGPNNRSNSYYAKVNHIRLARIDRNRSEFFGTQGGIPDLPQIGIATLPVIVSDNGTASNSIITLTADATTNDPAGLTPTSSVWVVNGAEQPGSTDTPFDGSVSDEVLTIVARQTFEAPEYRDTSTDSMPITLVGVPDPFTAPQWTLTTGLGSAELIIDLLSLPDDGGDAIQDVEYDVELSNSWEKLGATALGPYTITMPAPSTSYDIRIRAVNSIGGGDPSDVKTATSGAFVDTPFDLVITPEAEFLVEEAVDGTNVTITLSAPSNIAGVYNMDSANLAAGPWPLVPPRIENTSPVLVGTLLTVVPSLWPYQEGTNPQAVNYAWLRGGAPTGVTTETYTTQAADVGSEITREDSLTDDNGTRTSVSNAVSVISGTASIDDITADTGGIHFTATGTTFNIYADTGGIHMEAT